jgi:hypothetical protein
LMASIWTGQGLIFWCLTWNILQQKDAAIFSFSLFLKILRDKNA